jgi:CrcB protein
MMGYLVVFAGAGVGGAIRHGMNIWVARLLGTHFPWHTFIINVVGSTVMGLVVGLFAARGIGAEGHTRLFLTTGILGGFTTFSAFSLDAVLLWERHEHLLAGLYVGGSVVASIAGLVLGLWIMRTALG